MRYFQPTDYFLSGGEAEEAEVERAPGGHGHLARLWGSVSAAEELQETCGAAGAQHFSFEMLAVPRMAWVLKSRIESYISRLSTAAVAVGVGRARVAAAY